MEENQNTRMPYLRSLANCLKKMMVAGYTEIFRKNEKGLESLTTSKTYSGEDIKTINSFRFEGPAGSRETATMYVIETRDGLKGTMVDTEEIKRSDPDINSFIREINYRSSRS